MPGNASSITVPTIGMIRGLNSGAVPENSYCYAFSANVQDFDDKGAPNLFNESSALLNVVFPARYKVVGFIRIKEYNRTIYMLLDPTANSGTGLSSFAEVRDHNCMTGPANFPLSNACGCNSYYALESTPLEKVKFKPCNEATVIKTAACLNFSINHPNRIEYDIVDCQIRLYFTDNNNVRRFVYLRLKADGFLEILPEFHTISGYDDCENPIYSQFLDCAKIKVQPDVKPVCITFIDEIAGGGLKAGVYQFFAALATTTGIAMTSYSPATNEIPIFRREITNSVDYETSSAIVLHIEGFEYNTIHRYYNLVVAKTINNITTYELLATLPLSTKDFVYTGTDAIKEQLTADDVNQKYAYYEKAKNVTSANKLLMWHGMKEYSKGNWQRVANLVKLMWQTTQLPVGYYKKPLYAYKNRSYLRDEVQPFGLIIGFTNGEETDTLHIPGREITLTDQGTPSLNDIINIPNCADNDSLNEYWRTYNTASVIGAPHQTFKECEDTIWEYGEFAYWESIRKYPNDPTIWGDLCNQPIRFHKFPDCKIAPIHDNTSIDINLNQYGNNMIYPMGIRLDHLSIYNAIDTCVTAGLITAEQRDRVSYYRIVRGNRVGHESIKAKGLLYDVNTIATIDTWSADPIPPKIIYYPNYPFNSLQDDPYISFNYATYKDADSSIASFKTPFIRTNRFTFHSPDTHFRQPGIGSIINFESLEHGQAIGNFKKVDEHAKFKFLTAFSYILALISGTGVALSVVNKESKVVNRKDYWYNTKDDKDKGEVNGNTMYTGTEINSNNELTSVDGNTSYSLNTKNSKEADWNLGQKKNDPDGNTCKVNDWKHWDQHYGKAPDKRYAEETLTMETGRPHDFIGNVSGGNPYDTGYIYGEKKHLNPLFNVGAGTGLIIPRLMYITTLALIEIDKFLLLIEQLSPFKNIAMQYQGVGHYTKSDFTNIVNGNRRRQVIDYAYLKPEIASIDEKVGLTTTTQTITFNNYNRESSLYLKLYGAAMAVPNIQDTSRYLISDYNNGKHPGSFNARPISSYYVSLKTPALDQYGSIYDIDYVETGHCRYMYTPLAPTNPKTTIFGGDTFICKMALKRKHSFFNETAFRLPNQSDFFYQDHYNVGYPNFYFNTKIPLGERLSQTSGQNIVADLFTPPGPVGFVKNVLGVPKNRLDAAPLMGGGMPSVGELFYQTGFIYLHSYGIPYFITESTINLDFRHGENTKEADFYPRQKDLDYWLQEKNVSIKEDNQYHYNKTYSKQNNNAPLVSTNPDFVPNDNCSVDRPNELIYSLEHGINDKVDHWLTYKPFNRTIFDMRDGYLIAVNGVDNDKVLCRFQNNISLFNAYSTLATSTDTVQVGNGEMFKSKPQQFSKTELGHVGTQHHALVLTDDGAVWTDAKNGKFWILRPGNGGIDELGTPENRMYMAPWFKANLPFQVLKDFSNMTEDDIDNNFKGIGLILGYDKLYNRLLVTKKDYKKINNDVLWDADRKCFYVIDKPYNTIVNVEDPRYFCNKSWTISYNFTRNFWVSYHPYLPNYYIPFSDHFQAGLNSYETEITNSSLWDFNLTNKSYQVFFGKLFPFEVDFFSRMDPMYSTLNGISCKLDVYRYHNEFDSVYVNDVFFNKGFIYNDTQCTGMLHFNQKDRNDLRLTYPYYDSETGFKEIEVCKTKGVWNFNQFYDSVNLLNDNIPFLLHNCSNTKTYLNLSAFKFTNSYEKNISIRSEQVRVRLINDEYSNYKIVLKWLNFDKQTL